MTKVLGSRVEGALPHTIKAIRETCSQYHPKWQQNMKQLHRTQEQWDRAVHYNYSVRRLCWSNRQDNKESKGIQVRQSVHVSLFADDTVLPIKDSKNSTRNLLETFQQCGKIQNLLAQISIFSYINHKHTEEITDTCLSEQPQRQQRT